MKIKAAKQKPHHTFESVPKGVSKREYIKEFKKSILHAWILKRTGFLKNSIVEKYMILFKSHYLRLTYFNPVIGFYMKYNTVLKYVKREFEVLKFLNKRYITYRSIYGIDSKPFLYVIVVQSNDVVFLIYMCKSWLLKCLPSKYWNTCSKSTIETIGKDVKYVKS